MQVVRYPVYAMPGGDGRIYALMMSNDMSNEAGGFSSSFESDRTVPFSGRVVDPEFRQDDEPAGPAIRPAQLEEFVGQGAVVDNLRVYIRAARKRGESLDHVLLSGMPGLGKTTLAQLLANEMGASYRSTSGPILEKGRDLVGILTELEEGDVLFIDEIHRIQPTVEEYLYSAMEDFEIDIMIDSGPNARSLKIHLPRFTLVAATTREGNLTAPFRARFGIQEKLDPYPPIELEEIIARSSKILEVPIDAEGAGVLARRCRGTPRIANRYLRRIRDFWEVGDSRAVDRATVVAALERLGVDQHGLDHLDRRILEVLVRSRGVPVGVKTISVSVGEDERTIEDVYEPYLIRMGFVAKTPRGRTLGPAVDLLGLQAPDLMNEETPLPGLGGGNELEQGGRF